MTEDRTFESTIFLDMIPYTASEYDIVGFLLGCGNITSIHLSKREDGKTNYGYGIVSFSTPKEAEIAVQYCRSELLNGDRVKAYIVQSFIRRESVEEDEYSFLANKPVSEVEGIIKRISLLANENPIQAQFVLQGNANLLKALVEAEYKYGMVKEPVAGLDILLQK